VKPAAVVWHIARLRVPVETANIREGVCDGHAQRSREEQMYYGYGLGGILVLILIILLLTGRL